MANHLTMALIDTIRILHARGWSQRRIARELDIHRDTVARYLQALDDLAKPAIAPLGSDQLPADAKPAIAPLGSDQLPADAKPAIAPIGATPAEPVPKPAIAPIGAEAIPADQSAAAHAAPQLTDHTPVATPAGADRGRGRPSDSQPFQLIILDKLTLGLSAQRIFQDLVADHGFPGSYYSVRRFVQRLEQATPLPFRRMECAAGQEAQVDFGQGAPIIDEQGKRRRPHVLRIVLSHSRKGYSEVIDRQTTDAFIGAVENAFWAWGGLPQELILDNLRAAVSKADWFDPDINPKVRAFADYYGIALLPTRPYTPRHKGKIERGVDYVQENALKGRTFSSLVQQNAFLHSWEETVADTRVHGTTRQQVGKLFLEVERPALRPLPAARFPFFHEGQRTVHRDGHVEVARAYYSVPPEYLARRLWVRWDGRLVRIFNNRLEQVAVHVQQEPGRFSTQRAHIASEKISGAERGTAWLLARIGNLGGQAVRWAQAVIAHRGVEGVRVLQGLLALSGRHGAAAIDQACGIALSYGEYRLRTIRALLSRDAPKQEQFAFLEDHPLIRSLADYAQLVHTSFQQENGT